MVNGIDPFGDSSNRTLVALVVLLPLCLSGVTEAPAGVLCRVLGFVGMFSYNIYLWHLVARNTLVQVVHKLTGIEEGFVSATLIYFGGSLLFGITATLFIERPFLILRERFSLSCRETNQRRE